MLRSIHLKNFQNHEDTFLELDPGVNVIVGASDSGKSAVLRALSWVLWNRPLGDAFRSRWGGDTAVAVCFDNGQVVRGINKGGYYIVDAAEAEVLRAFRTEVPEVVSAHLNLDPINVQAQHDAPFLLSGSSGEAARQLNRAARLDVIDRSLAAAESARRETVRNLDVAKTQTARLEASLEEFRDLDALEELVARAEAAEKGANSRLEAGARVRPLAEAATASRGLLKRLAAPLRLAPRVVGAEEWLRKLRDVQKRKDRVSTDVSVARASTARIDVLRTRLDKVPDVALNAASTRLDRINDKRKTAQAVRALVTQARKAQDAVEAGRNYARHRQDLFDEAMPDTCPLCGQEVA